MSSENQDWLSAASDNKALTKVQLDSLLGDAQLQQKLQRYHLIGSAMRSEVSSALPANFADNFMVQLADEPVYQLQSDRNLMQRIKAYVAVAANGSWLQPVAQGGIAAAVALIAVFGVQQYQQGEEYLTPQPLLQTQPIAGFATPVSLSQTTVTDRFAAQEQQAMLEQQKRLQAMLNAHRQQLRVMEQTQQAKQSATPHNGSEQNEQ